MTWWNKDYRRRQIITIDAIGGSGVSATIDFTITIPADWDGFWDNIRSDFKDVVITSSKGVKLNFSRQAVSNYAFRILTIDVDGYTIENDNTLNVAYVYFNYADEATDHSTTTTITSPKNAFILLSAPHTRLVSTNVAENAVEQPAQSFIKTESERVHVFFAFSRFLANRIEDYNERVDEEGISHVTLHSYDSSGTDSSSRYALSETRFGNGFVRATFIGGNNNNDYAIVCTFYTTLSQVLETRAILRVKSLLP